jgi:hypothetical protein
VRIVATVAAAGCLTAGALVGDDDAFPFGPFRMYSTANKPSGAVTYFSIESRVANGSWERAALSPRNVGMNRAEVEGQIPKIVANPDRLGTLAEARRRLRPDQPPWVGVRLVRNRSILENRAPTGEIERTIMAQWVAR